MPKENVYLFIPNLIGYARIALALLAFALMPCCPLTAIFIYLISFLLDDLDGRAARAFNQCSKFGAMMDILTDCCASMCLLVNLSQIYPSYTFLFQIIMCSDVAGHWLHVHSSSIMGSTSHKIIDPSGNIFLRIYYNELVLLVLWLGNGLFFCLLFLLHHIQEPAAWLYWLQGLCGTTCLLKTAISLVHLVTAAQYMAALDTTEREKSVKTQ